MARRFAGRPARAPEGGRYSRGRSKTGDWPRRSWSAMASRLTRSSVNLLCEDHPAWRSAADARSQRRRTNPVQPGHAGEELRSFGRPHAGERRQSRLPDVQAHRSKPDEPTAFGICICLRTVRSNDRQESRWARDTGFDGDHRTQVAQPSYGRPN